MNKPKSRPKIKPSGMGSKRPSAPARKSIKRSPTSSGTRRPPSFSTGKQPYKPPQASPKRPVSARPPQKQPLAGVSPARKQPYRPPVKQVPTSSRPAMTVFYPAGLIPVQSINRQSITDSYLIEEINVIESQLDSLAGELTLEDHVNAVNDLDQGILELPVKIEELRDRGYRYQNFLEKKADAIAQKWEAIESQVRADIKHLSEELFTEFDSIVKQYNGASQVNSISQPTILGIKQEVQALKARLSSADAHLRGLYGNIQQTLSQTRQQLGTVEFLMDSIEQARFPLLLNEGPIDAVVAKWWRDGDNEGPVGVLILTDQRLLFEQKERIPTKKFLFITTESELKHELVFEIPIMSIEDIKQSNRGIGGFQNHIDLKLGTGSLFPYAHFHLKDRSSNDWVVLIKKAKSGEISNELAGADTGGTSSLEIPATIAPEKCSSCGAPIPALTSTQRQHICEYCGTTMRW